MKSRPSSPLRCLATRGWPSCARCARTGLSAKRSPFVEEMTNVVMKEMQRCRDADVSLDNWLKRTGTEIAESPDKNETPEPSSRR